VYVSESPLRNRRSRDPRCSEKTAGKRLCLSRDGSLLTDRTVARGKAAVDWRAAKVLEEESARRDTGPGPGAVISLSPALPDLRCDSRSFVAEVHNATAESSRLLQPERESSVEFGEQRLSSTHNDRIDEQTKLIHETQLHR
jgi:hypothetical protein